MTQAFRNPTPTVDVVIFDPARGVLLIERKNPPAGWALPGGFVDEGETVEAAAIREAREETGLEVVLTDLLGVYSDPARDPRKHTMSTVFIGQAVDPTAFTAGDDAGAARFFPLGAWPAVVAFDHLRILEDFLARLRRYNPGL
ncbi:MAG: NUDIX hydrolase [Desulfovibrio sp.]|nr:NUDIX hydrolase [Desulfovibrio sp.]MCA1985442.1 NUDIX hydrolase [Desulfovibrio sp.]